MLIMALDHASFFLNKVHPSEFWGIALPQYPGLIEFATRFVTHLCAPGFFLTMGMGMAFWHEKHATNLPVETAIRHFGARALLILLIHQLLENPAWILGILTATTSINTYSPDLMPGSGADPLTLFGVLYSLAASMFVWAFLLRLRTSFVLLISAAAVIVSQYAVPATADVHESFGILYRMLLIPGQSGRVIVTYPILPWLGICGLGIAMGRHMIAKQSIESKLVPLLGTVFIALFILARFSGIGSHHPFEAGTGWLGFFNLTKYPPSINFSLLMVGANLLILFALQRRPIALGKMQSVFQVFGRTPLFFYLAHLWMLSIIGLLFRGGGSYLITFGGWLLVAIALYPMCQKYVRFRSKKAGDSLWRAL